MSLERKKKSDSFHLLLSDRFLHDLTKNLIVLFWLKEIHRYVDDVARGQYITFITRISSGRQILRNIDMASSLTDAQFQELKDAFNVFDTDGSGQISAEELGNVFRALSISINDHQLKQLLEQMDSDSSGQIGFDEFSRVMAETFFKKYSQDELRAAFRQFDEDDSGYIQAAELENIMRKLGRPASKNQIAALIRSLDISGDGKIGFDEFVQLF